MRLRRNNGKRRLGLFLWRRKLRRMRFQAACGWFKGSLKMMKHDWVVELPNRVFCLRLFVY